MRSPQNGCFGLIMLALYAGICIASGRAWWIVALTIVGGYFVAAVVVWAVYAWRESRLAVPPPPRPAHLGAQLYEPERALGAPSSVLRSPQVPRRRFTAEEDQSDPRDTRVF